MSETLSIDFETRSTVDLRRTGVYPYAAHPETDIWCMAYAFDDEEPELWVPPMSIPTRIINHIRLGRPLRAWNATFERVVWACILHHRYGFPLPKRAQWFDTAADAAAMALPRALNRAALALGLDEEKDDEGHRLMMRMARPRKKEKGGNLIWWDEPDKLQRLYDYCLQDVRVERAVFQRIRPLGAYEQGIYLLDQKINDRGVRLDRTLIEAAQKIVEEGTRRANVEIERITGGEVATVTKVKDLTVWLQAAGLDLDNVRKDTLRDLLGDDAPDLDPVVQRVIELRAETAKSSTAKLVAMLEYIYADDRARGMLLYHGAGTGRWAGKGPQPQNYPRPENLCNQFCASALGGSCDCGGVERFIPLVLAGDYDGIEAESPPLVVIASLLRAMFVATPGHRLVAGDFAQIEARVLAWIAGQDDLVHAFATGAKIYEEMGAAYSGKPLEEIGKDSEERQVGKNSVLGCGFGMGADTFATQVQKQTGIVLPRGERDEEGNLLPGEHDVAQDIIDIYRRKYGRIKGFWYEIEGAAIRAVQTPGSVQTCGRGGAIRYTVRGQFLWCILPSGRPLAYAKPEIRERKTPWGEMKAGLSFMGNDSYTRQWKRQHAYGGLLTENVVQAMARDLMAGAMVRLEDAGYPVVLTVHDEILTDTPEGHGSLDEFLKTMQLRPRWAAGLPVAVEGWEGERYRK